MERFSHFYVIFCIIFQVFAVQHVDVCMFSNGKFKNVVADETETYQIKPGDSYRKEYSLLPMKGIKQKNRVQTFNTKTCV